MGVCDLSVFSVFSVFSFSSFSTCCCASVFLPILT